MICARVSVCDCVRACVCLTVPSSSGFQRVTCVCVCKHDLCKCVQLLWLAWHECVWWSEFVYSVVVSTWCASLMCETSAMTVEPSAPKGEIEEIECKCVCVWVRIFALHAWVSLCDSAVHARVCVCTTDYLPEPTSCCFFVHVGHQEVSEPIPAQLKYLIIISTPPRDETLCLSASVKIYMPAFWFCLRCSLSSWNCIAV